MSKITIYDIAKLTGTNITAVSRAFRPDAKISKKKREMILKVAEEQGYRPNPIAGSLSRKKIRVGVAYFYTVPEFSEQQLFALSEKAKDLADLKLSVEIVKCTNEQQVVETIRYFREKGMHGILTNGLSERDASCELIEECERAGVPVGLFTSDVPNSARSVCVSNHLEIAARTACDVLNLCGGGRDTLVFAGKEGYIHQTLAEAFQKRAEELGGRVLKVIYTDDDPDKAERLVKQALSEHPRVSGIYVSSANSIPVLKQLVYAGKAHKVRVVTSDVFSALSAFIREGTVDATVYQKPGLQAAMALEILHRMLLTGVKEERLHTVVPEIVVAANLPLYETPSDLRSF